MIYMMAQYRAKPDQLDHVLEVVKSFLAKVKKNEPYTRYEVFHDGTHFMHLMSFRNRHDEEVHRLSPYTRDFVEHLYPNCEDEPKFTRMEKIT